MLDRFLGVRLPFYAPDGVGGGDGGAAAKMGSGGSDSGGAGGGSGSGAAGSAAGGASGAGNGGAGDGGGAGAASGGAAAATLAGGGDAPPAVVSKFPDNWRDLVAGSDEAAKKDLAKYTDPNAMYKSLRDVQAKISRGELKANAALPANATPEQMAAYRTANGLPDKVEGYVEKLALGDGVVLGEADKPLVDDFAKLALDKGWSPSQFNDAVGWFYQMQDAVESQRLEADGEHKTVANTELAQEWGQDYKVNMNAMGSLLATMPEDLRSGILTARTADGRMLGNDPNFIRWAAGQAREFIPSATLVPAGDANALKTMTSERESIEKSMYTQDGRPNPEYWRDDKKQARYRELVDAEAKMSNRGRAA